MRQNVHYQYLQHVEVRLGRAFQYLNDCSMSSPFILNATYPYRTHPSIYNSTKEIFTSSFVRNIRPLILPSGKALQGKVKENCRLKV